MSRPLQLEFTWRDLGQRYIGLLESDLKLERERLVELRRDLEFYRGKCERLELAMASQGNAAQQHYATRTDLPPARAATLERTQLPTRKSFAELKREWNALTEAQQEEIEKSGKWDTEEVTNAGQ